MEKRKAVSVKAGEMCVVVEGTKGGDIGIIFPVLPGPHHWSMLRLSVSLRSVEGVELENISSF